MKGRLNGLTRIACVIVTGLAVPAWAQAGDLILRNDTPAALVVHASCVHQGSRYESTPQQLAPKMKSAPIQLPGNRLIVNIYDARFPARPLLQMAVPASTTDTLLSIQPDPALPRIALRRP